MATFSKEQFGALAERANAPGGGFSVRPKPNAQGEIEQVTDSYMVGGVPGSTGASHDSPISGRPIVSFMRSNRAALASGDTALGAWHDEQRTPASQVDLDVSNALTRSPETKMDASSLTLKRNEMAFGEIGHKPTEYTQHDNPFSTRRITPEAGVADYRKALRSDPRSYEAVVSGNVLGGMFDWVTRR
jgi:hypothetical protein